MALGAPNRQIISRYKMSAVSSAVVDFTGNASAQSVVASMTKEDADNLIGSPVKGPCGRDGYEKKEVQ